MNKKTKETFFQCLTILLPIVLWLFVFRGFLKYEATVNLDTLLSYGPYKFFLNSLLNGTLPLWDPYLYLGTPFYSIFLLGFFNPLIYLSLFLILCGVNYYSAYLFYLIASFFLGCIGFYFLGWNLFQQKRYAFVGYVLVLFCGIAGMVFTQINMLLIFVPSVWFFYFFLRFFQTFKSIYFLAIVYCVMLLLTSYLPFHFVTFFLVFLLVSSAFYPQKAKNAFFDSGKFIKTHKKTVLLGGIAVAISLLPFTLYRLSDKNHDIVYPARNCADKDIKECVRLTTQGKAQMTYEDVTKFGGLGERVEFHDLFSHLDKISFGIESHFYLPVVVYLILFLTVLTPLERREVCFIVTGIIVFFIALGSAHPLHKFLYHFGVYFSSFRNLFFFMIFLMPLTILLAVSKLKQIMMLGERKPKLKDTLFLVGAHILFLAFLIYQGSIISTSYLTVFLSLAFSLAVLCKGLRKNFIKEGLFFLLIVVQPLQVFYFYSQNAKPFKSELPKTHVPVKFALLRPQQTMTRPTLATQYNVYVNDFWYDMLLEDASGAVGFPAILGKEIFNLVSHVPDNFLAAYTRYKFILYDKVAAYQGTDEGLIKLVKSWQDGESVAFVVQPPRELINQFREAKTTPTAITGQGNGFEAVTFTPNTLRFMTDYTQDKFLVYTQTFHSSWKLNVNGRKARLYEANGGFQGIWLPAGHNVVALEYSSPGGTKAYVLVILFFQLFFSGIILKYLKEKMFPNLNWTDVVLNKYLWSPKRVYEVPLNS